MTTKRERKQNGINNYSSSNLTEKEFKYANNHKEIEKSLELRSGYTNLVGSKS